MARAVPVRRQGLDPGDADLLALAKIQKLKQVNLIERDLP